MSSQYPLTLFLFVVLLSPPFYLISSASVPLPSIAPSLASFFCSPCPHFAFCPSELPFLGSPLPQSGYVFMVQCGEMLVSIGRRWGQAADPISSSLPAGILVCHRTCQQLHVFWRLLLKPGWPCCKLLSRCMGYSKYLDPLGWGEAAPSSLKAEKETLSMSVNI